MFFPKIRFLFLELIICQSCPRTTVVRVGISKSVVWCDLQQLYSYAILWYISSTACLLFAYSWKLGSHCFRKATFTIKVQCLIR
jgi:hypothetical protein